MTTPPGRFAYSGMKLKAVFFDEPSKCYARMLVLDEHLREEKAIIKTSVGHINSEPEFTYMLLIFTPRSQAHHGAVGV